MKKGMLLFSFLALILVLAGCGSKDQSGNQAQKKDMTQGGNMSAISSIKDAMGLGKTMKCTYRVEAGENSMEMVTYVKGEKYRAENKNQDGQMISVFDGDTIYTWENGKKQGTKMTKKCMDELSQMSQNMNQEREMNQGDQPQNMEQNFDNAMDVKCEEVSDINLSISNEIEFEDQCEQMKNSINQAQEMMKKYQGQMPGGNQ